MVNFFTKAKSRATTFFKNTPSHLQKARTFFTGAVGHAKRINDVVQHVNRGVQENDLFGTRVKAHSKSAADFTDVGLQKISDVHQKGDKFIQHLASYGAENRT